jgi:hypothetical protein
MISLFRNLRLAYKIVNLVVIIIKISAKEIVDYYELKKHKPWFDESYSKLLDQRKQAKLQWLQDPSEKMGIISRI